MNDTRAKQANERELLLDMLSTQFGGEWFLWSDIKGPRPSDYQRGYLIVEGRLQRRAIDPSHPGWARGHRFEHRICLP